MNANLQINCENMIINKENMKKIFGLEDGRIHTVCAALYAQAGMQVDRSRIEACKRMIKDKVSVFSEIRGHAMAVITCMIDIRGGKELYVDQMTEAYRALRQEFHASALLVLGAQILAENYAPGEFASIAQKAKVLYKDMKSNHPFLTGEDDYLMCILLAQSDREISVLGNEIEQCYVWFKENGFQAPGNALQAVSCALALYDGEATAKCRKAAELYHAIKASGYKYDKHYGLPMLAVLSQSDMTIDQAVGEIREVNDWLKDKKGFGMLMGEANRMVYAAMFVSQSHSADKHAGTSVAGGVISAIIAEQLAMIACMSATTAAAASN